MTPKAPTGRRVFLGCGVVGTFLLPSWFHDAAARRPSAGSPAPRSAPPTSRLPAPLVMLDPGHGGKDPGAIGVSGTYEKHVALAAAEELRGLLERGDQYKVAMTRVRDVFVPLDERVARAQRHGAALFVSMHADAVGDRRVRGASVYTLATHASDEQTAALAARENNADRAGGARYGGTTPEVAQILASLVRQETRQGSARMAHSVVGQFRPDVPMLDNPSRHAGFVVLKAADIPSVLLEMGFMSNSQDEAALRKPAHRREVALAMKRAIDGYFATGYRSANLAG